MAEAVAEDLRVVEDRDAALVEAGEVEVALVLLERPAGRGRRAGVGHVEPLLGHDLGRVEPVPAAAPVRDEDGAGERGGVRDRRPRVDHLDAPRHRPAGRAGLVGRRPRRHVRPRAGREHDELRRVGVLAGPARLEPHLDTRPREPPLRGRLPAAPERAVGGRAAREPELAADRRALLEQGDGGAGPRGLERGGDARGPAADHEHVAPPARRRPRAASAPAPCAG